MSRLFALLLLAFSCLFGCNQPPTPAAESTSVNKTPNALLQLTDKQKAIQIIKGIQTSQQLPDIPFTDRFKHHIQTATPGKTGFLAHLNTLQRKSVEPVRFVEEHEYVITHCREQTDSSQFISFLVFRFEDGHLAEYWENRQPEITKTKSGRTMIDGPTVVSDLDRTEYNKALLRRHFLDINYIGKMARLPDLINANKFHQHNPTQPDGLKHLSKLITGKKRRAMAYCKLRLLLGQGDMVFTIWDYPKDDALVTVHELWRVEKDKIVEHWDVISSSR